MKIRFADFVISLAVFFCITGHAAAGSILAVDSDRLFEYALKSFKNADYPEAASSFHSFDHFFSEDPRSEKACVLRGFSLFYSKRYSDSAEAFRRIFDSKACGREARNISGLMLAACHDALKDRPSAIAFTENWAASLGPEDPFLDRVRYEAFWLYLSDDNIKAAEKSIAEIKAVPEFRIPELREEMSRVRQFEKSPGIAGTLAVIPGGGFAYLGRYSDAFAALVVNSALGAAAWQSFDKDMPALGGIISFVGVGFYLGGIYGSVSATEKMNRRSRASLFDSMRTRLYVREKNLGAVFSVDF